MKVPELNDARRKNLAGLSALIAVEFSSGSMNTMHLDFGPSPRAQRRININPKP
jgi:hypothetical protein